MAPVGGGGFGGRMGMALLLLSTIESMWGRMGRIFPKKSHTFLGYLSEQVGTYVDDLWNSLPRTPSPILDTSTVSASLCRIPAAQPIRSLRQSYTTESPIRKPNFPARRMAVDVITDETVTIATARNFDPSMAIHSPRIRPHERAKRTSSTPAAVTASRH